MWIVRKALKITKGHRKETQRWALNDKVWLMAIRYKRHNQVPTRQLVASVRVQGGRTRASFTRAPEVVDRRTFHLWLYWAMKGSS